MLDVAKVITLSATKRFDTVVFFDRESIFVNETQKRIPGAIGFPGDFVDIVLLDDSDDDKVVDGRDYLTAPPTLPDELRVRKRQVKLAIRQDFIRCFPFDVINLDLEEFLFKPNDPYPGKVINALRKVFGWQRRPLGIPPMPGRELDGFSLMFTTQIGPPNISDNYLGLLRERLIANLQDDTGLHELLTIRAGESDVTVLQGQRFDLFFKLAVPKVLASVLMEEDWYIDPSSGISIYEFSRPSVTGPYKILHLVMDVRRHSPPRERRGPGEASGEALAAYRQVVRSIFTDKEILVSEETIDRHKLLASLDTIKARRRKYYPDEALDTMQMPPD